MKKQELKSLIKEEIRIQLMEGSYNDDLNTLLEPEADEDLKKILSPIEYNTFFLELGKIDKHVSKKAYNVGEEYFPLETLAKAVEYLYDYIQYIPERYISSKFKLLLRKIKNAQ